MSAAKKKKPAPKKPAPKKPAPRKARPIDLTEELAPPPGGYAPEADFDDTIAKNRGLAIPAASSVPGPTEGYTPTDPSVRRTRLRKIAGSLRAEALVALDDLGARGAGVQKDLGPFAPDCTKSPASIASRLRKTGPLIQAAMNLLRFAQEEDQIALSDAVVLLEAVNKQLQNAASQKPQMLTAYASVAEIFATRASAIKAGRDRAKAKSSSTTAGTTDPTQ